MSKKIITNFENRQEFKNFISSYRGVVIVKFTADWCGPCKRVKPLILDLYKNMPGNVILADLNIDENQDVYAFSKIRSVPTMISFVNGDKMDVIDTSNPTHITAFFNTCKKYANH